MRDAMRRIAVVPAVTRTLGLLLAAGLTACSLPARAPAARLYDFGPPAEMAADPAAGGASTRPVLALQVQASTALESSAMLYRLAYADAQQLQAYSESRWVMPPAELLQQRLREGLGRHYLLLPGEGARLLHVELQEFSQLFTAPQQSSGLLRLRASVLQRTATGEQLLAQREWQFQQPAPSPNAAGGVQALNAASARAAQELAQWLQQLR